MEAWRDALTIQPQFIRDHETQAAVVNDRIVGFYALDGHDKRLELAHLWVLPEMMGRGIGRALFAHAAARAKELGYREMEIESDPNAEGFYLRLGARRAGTNSKMLEGGQRDLPVLIFEL